MDYFLLYYSNDNRVQIQGDIRRQNYLKIILIHCFTQLDEEFDEITPDGREVKAKVKFENGKIMTVQKAKRISDKSTKSIRELIGDEFVYTMTIDGIDHLTCVQKFKRMQFCIIVSLLFHE